MLEKPTKLIVSSKHVYSIILARFNCAQIPDLIHHSYQLNCKKQQTKLIVKKLILSLLEKTYQVNCKKQPKFTPSYLPHKKNPCFTATIICRSLFACTLFFAKKQAWTTHDPPPGLCQQTERALKLHFHKQVLHKLRRLNRMMGTKGMQR
jgi:hypothetical protein